MDNNIQNIDFQDTTPEYNDDEQNNVDQSLEEGVIPNGENPTKENVVRDAEKLQTQESASDAEALTEPFITVQYNHKNRNFTKEEAVKLIQKGMHTESLRTKLEYLARKEKTDINSLVDKIISRPEVAYRSHLENLYGANSEEVEIGMKIYRQQQSEEYRKIIKDLENAKTYDDTKNSINSRLADEYLFLKEQIPDVPGYSDLPDSVILEAANGKRDLFSAYLCHLHKEQSKINAAKKAENAAAAASLGEMARSKNDFFTSSERDFIAGLWSK